MLALLIDPGLSADEISSGRVNKLGLLEDLPENEEDDGVGDGEVAGDETLLVEGLEDVEADEEESSAAEKETEVG